MSQLFENSDDEADSESNRELSTSGSYAKNYDAWRQKEELHKLHMKYGNDVDEESTASSSDDDAEEDLVDGNFEKAFLRTLSCLKNKDPSIYNDEVAFFDKAPKVGESTSKKTTKKEQPMYLKDYERKMILDGGHESDEDRKPTYVEEQKGLKEELKSALEVVVKQEEEEGWGGMFAARKKTDEEVKKEQEDYVEWLAGQREHLNDEGTEKELQPLKDFWRDPKLDKGEAFLRDYILNKRFLEEDAPDYIPTYDEIVHDSDGDLSEDERAIDKQDEFEHKYNFRFEEPDEDFIKRYPRAMESSLRKQDDRRRLKRAELKERKKKEKTDKMEEIRQLKAMKRKEIEEKISKLKEITGDAGVQFQAEDLVEDFDPEAHDRRMHNLFSDDFYAVPEGDKKPEFPELDKELELEHWDHWHGDDDDDNRADENEPHCEDADFNMDAEYDPKSALQQELMENTRKHKKRRRKSKFATAVGRAKPAFDPTDKTYQQYLDEYYALDCEDVIGDLPCRFKYREVVPNSFGLSIQEILTAKDKELNRWCSLKKAVQRRPEHVEKYDVLAFEKKGKNEFLKRKYLPSLFGKQTEGVVEEPTTTANADEKEKDKAGTEKQTGGLKRKQNSGIEVLEEITPQVPKKKRKKQRGKSKEKQELPTPEVNEEIKGQSVKKKNKKKAKVPHSSAGEVEEKQKQSVKKKNKIPQNGTAKESRKKKNADAEIAISDARLSAFGINPKKFKNKLKYKQ